MKSDIELQSYAKLCLSLQFYFWVFFVAYLKTHTLLNLTKEESKLERLKKTECIPLQEMFANVGGAVALCEAR